MRWLEVLTKIPGSTESLYGDQIRAKIARQAHGTGLLPSELFHYSPDGRPMDGMARIRFGGGKGAFRVFAVGDDAVELLDSVAHRITRLAGDIYDQVLTETRYSGAYSLTSAYPSQYRIPLMVYAINRADEAENKDAFRAGVADEKLVEKLRAKITRSLREQAVILAGGDESALPRFAVDDVAVVHEGNPFTLVVRKEGAGHMPAIKNVVFRTNLDLRGPWHVGHLTARGYGHVLKKEKRA